MTRNLLTLIIAAAAISACGSDAAEPECTSSACDLADTQETLTCYSATYSYEVERTGLELSIKCSAAGDLQGQPIKVPDTTQQVVNLGEDPGAWPAASCSVRFMLNAGPFVYADLEANDRGTAAVTSDYAAANFTFDRCDYSGVMPL